MLIKCKNLITLHFTDYEKWNIGFSRLQFKKRVGPNVTSTMILLRPIEKKNNKPTGQFAARLSTKVEHSAKQRNPYRCTRLIKATASAILAF